FASSNGVEAPVAGLRGVSVGGAVCGIIGDGLLAGGATVSRACATRYCSGAATSDKLLPAAAGRGPGIPCVRAAAPSKNGIETATSTTPVDTPTRPPATIFFFAGP